MSTEGTPLYNDSNWTFMYVLLGLIPIVFVAVAFYSLWRDRAIQRQDDIEMAVYARTFHQAWFPWRDAVDMSEKPGGTARADPMTRPPVLPPSFSAQVGESSKGQGTAGRTRGRSHSSAQVGHSHDFEDVLL
ncbi:hypothetical protein F4677DRAFT_59587 [Hypoxylon crocopeplum]|nr:hypothetical protein F4677DRAFT_59587 [Hypoxylon crocopeplum]